MSAFAWLWASLAAWIVLDLLLAAWWAWHRRRENRARRDAEAEELAGMYAQFDQIIAAEYPAIPAQRQPRKDEPR